MKKLLISLGMGLALLGATLFTPTQAQSDFFAPLGQSYQVESKAGTFTDISGLSGTVQVNLSGSSFLRGLVFGATTAGGTTPTATQIESGQATVNCFPIGFDLPFLGKTMKYFAISSGGGVFFSETPTRAVPCPFKPTGDASAFEVLTIPYCKDKTVNISTKQETVYGKDKCPDAKVWPYSCKVTVETVTIETATSSSAQGTSFQAPAGKAPACYRVDGAAGDRVLTVQHDYCIVRPVSKTENETDEWIYQFKFYERDGSFEMVIKELQQNHNMSTTSMNDYKLAIGVVATYTTPSDYIFGSSYLNVQPNNGQSYSMSIADATTSNNNNWQNFKASSYSFTSCPVLTPSNKPESGRTIRWWNAQCASQPQPHPAVGEDAFIIDVSYPNTTSAKVQVRYDMTKFASLAELYQAGTIVGVLSDSEEPDFTLQDGTLYLKDHTFPAQNGKAAPTVVFNRMYNITNSQQADGDAYPCGYKNSSYTTENYYAQTTVENLEKGTARYIHLYRMSYVCGTPLYSPLCHTIELANKFRTEKPDLLETAGLPTVHALGLKVKPHEGDDVMVVKTHDLNKVKEIPEEGPHAAGATIAEDLVVIGTYSEETTFQVTGLPDDDICYFVAVPVNKETREYDNVHTINCRARVAHSGVPFDLDFRNEANGNPYKWIDRQSQKEDYYKDVYRPLPVGWTRTDNQSADRRDLGLGLGKPNFDGTTPVALYGQLEVNGTDADAISTPIYLNKGKIGVTYYMQFQYRNSGTGGTGVAETTPKADDKFIIEYSIGEGNNWSAWTEIASYQGSAFPSKKAWNGGEYYPLEARVIAPNSSLGKYLRFRFRMQTGSGHEAFPLCDYGCIYIMDVYESADCLTPTNLQQNQTNTTGTAIPLSWSDPNPAGNKATAFEVSYRKAYTGEAWQTLTVNTANATVSGLTSSTPYAFRVAAVCPSDKSLATDSAVFNTLYRYAYMETMIEDTGYFYYVGGSNAYARGLGPLERSVKTYTGTLPNTGNASLTATEKDKLMSDEETWTPKWGWDKWLLSRRCPQSMGVCQTAQNAWLVTPVIENNHPQQAQIVRFRASAGWCSAGSLAPANWTRGSVNKDTYGSCTLQVLLSNNGQFTKDDVVGTLDISSYTDLNNKTLEVKVPAEKAKTGHVQVALYYQNPNRQIQEQSKDISVYMFFEIQNLEYMDDACPDFEADAALTASDITTQGAKLTWPKLEVTFFDLSYKPAGGNAEDAEKVAIPAETLQADEDGNCSYTLTGLNDNTQYEVSVVGYCDEGRTMGTSALEGTFKTLEACHTPTDFKVEDITYNSAKFSSTPATQESNTMLHRLIYLEDANDASHVHIFKQDNNTLEATGLHDNRSLIAKTRAVCARGDSSAWSEPITFTTPADPATLPDTFNIVLKVQPENAGTLSTADGKTRYIEDEEVTMTATAKPGYRFVKWQDATGTQLSTNATYKWTATKEEGMESDTKTHEVAFTAVFMKQYTIALNTQPTGSTVGTVTGNGTYDEGTEVTLTASPTSNYLFVKWQKADGSVLSTDNPYKFTPTESATYTAVFRAKEKYTLDVTVVPNADWGSVSFNPQANEDDKYLEGRVVTMTATPAQYCRFKGWVSGNDTVSKELTYTVTMDGDKTYKAVFEQIHYKVTLVSNPSTEYGTITGTSGSTTTGGTFVAGSTRKLTAVPKAGYEFVKWMSGSQQLGTNPVLQFILTQDTTITAYFKEKNPLDITVTVEPAGAGTVTGAGKVTRGSNAALTAAPAAHYAFKEWKRLDGSTITTNPYTLTNVKRDYTFTAVFRALNNYTVTVKQEGQGTVTGAGTYEEGSNVTLTATPDAAAHYEFKEWQDANGDQYSEEATISFKATADVTYKAVFTEIPQYTVTVRRYLNATQNTGVGTIEGANASGVSYYRDTKVSLKANPAKGYKFVGWQKADGSATVSTANPYEFNLTAEVTYRAVFQENIRITVTVDPMDAGTATGAGLFDDNDEVTLTAYPNDDYVFVEWQNADGSPLNTANPYKFNATASKTIKARFRAMNHYSLNVTANEERGSVSLSPAAGEDGKYQEGTEVTLTANPKQYYKFLAWVNSKNNEDTLSKTNGHKVTMNRDTAVRAVFARIQYTVTLKSDPADWTWGTINGTSGNQSTGGVFDAGSQRHLEAKPRAGYEFVKWMSGDQQLGTNPVYEFILDKDITITAYFKEKNPLNINVTVQLGETENAAVGTVAVTGEGVTGNKVPRGKDAALTATPKAHYAFKEWRFASGTVSDQNPYTITNVLRDYTVKAVFRDLETYTVTVESTEGGSVTGAGNYEEGANVTLTATPNEHYAFTEWQDADGNTLETEATYTFKATGNTTVKAVFTELSKFTVTLLRYYNGEPTPAAGTLFGASSYDDGQEVEISASANKGYHFVKWQKPDGTPVSTDNPYTFNITGNTTYWAIYEANVNIAVTVAPTGAGTATGAGLYDEGDEVTLTASADADHVFVAWKEGSTELSTDNPYKFPAAASKNITAQFRGKETYNLDVNWDDELGNVTFDPTSDEGEYQEGTVVTMKATPKQYCKFVGWQEKGGTIVSTESTHMVTMDRDTAGTAVFARIEYEITLQSNPADWAWGTINGTDGNQSEGGTFFAGSKRTLTAVPKAGYEFVKWTSGDQELGTDAKYEFILTEDITITAHFKEKNPLNIAVTVEPANAGTVTGAGTVVRGNSATLEAKPAEHYAFKEWRRLDNTTVKNNPYTINEVLRDYTFTAVFRSLENYTVTVEPTEGGSVTGAGTYEEGAEVTLTATPDAHYAFTKWVINGEDQEGSDATLSFTAEGETSVKAVFTELPKYTVTVNRYVGTTLTPAGTITITGDKTADGKYYKGTEVSIEATANHGYTFVGWQLSTGGELVATNPYKFNITANVTYRAVFQENVRIAVSVDPEGAGEVTGAGLFDANDEVTLTATVDDDYLFVAWQDADGNTLETATTYTFTATASKTVTAKFREKEYFGINVPCISSDEEEDDLGTVSISDGDNDTWKEGETVKMKANPAPYCKFVEWRDKDGNVLGTDPTYSFVISKDTTFTAVFAHIQYTVTLVSNPNKDYGTINGTSGSASDGGTYNAGTTRKLEAKPRVGYEFVKWMGGSQELGTNPKLEFVLTRDTTITAYFKEKNPLDINVTVYLNETANAAVGTVAVTGEGVTGNKVTRGKDAVLTAKANAAYKFLYWENLAGEQFEDNPYTVNNVVRDYTFKAVFRAKYQYEVTVTRLPNTSAGTIERKGFLSNGKAREDTTVTLTAKPAEGYTFEGWQDATGATVSTEATLSFKATANVTYNAIFAEIPTPQYTVTLLKDPAEGGKISGDGDYDEGTEVTIKATPNTGYTFEGWYDGATKLNIGNPYTFTLNADVTYTAKFAAKPTVDVAVTVRLGATEDATVGTVTGAGSYEKGQTVTLKADPASEDYLFSGWRDLDNDDELIGSANPLTFEATANVNYAAVFREKFEVTLNILPDDNAGTVTGAGPGRQGYPRTITASPAEGYTFVGWLDEEGATVTTDASHTFILEDNVTFTAKFEAEAENEFDVKVQIKPNAEAGTVKGNGRFAEGEETTLTATAAENYLFVGWLKPKAEDATKFDTVSKNATYKITVEGNVTYTALFRARARYTIDVDILPNDAAGTVTGDGEVREGRTVTLKAGAAEGYTFVAWVNPTLTAPKDTVSRTATYTFTATGNATYKAVFRRTPVNYTMTLNVTPAGAGTVDGDGTYRANASVTLTATPNKGYTFVGWRNKAGDYVNREATYTFNITRNTEYTAVFKKKDVYSVELIAPEEAGTVEGDGKYTEGENVVIKATANRGYVFVEWQNEDGDMVSDKAEYRFKATTDVTYTAIFRKKATYSVSLNASPAEAGTVNGHGDYYEGENVTIEATAKEGYTFVEWRDADGHAVNSENPYTFEATANVTYTAVFEKNVVPTKEYTVKANVLPDQNAGKVTGTGTFNEGVTVTLKAEPAEGYTFVKWQDAAGKTLGTDLTYTFKATADVTYTAVFEKKAVPAKEYSVKANVLPNQNAGKVTGTGTYKEGVTVTLKAEPAEGYIFVKWQDAAGKTLGTDLTYTFKATADVTYTAVFEEKKPDIVTITLKAKPNDNAGTLRGAGKYEKGAQAIIVAMPASNYAFVAWLDAKGDTVSKTAAYSFKAETDATFTAVFKDKTANEQQLKAAFNVGAGNGHLYIDNLNALVVKEVSVFNTVGRQVAHFTPNSRTNLALPVDARYSVLVVRVVSEQGVAIYKVYLH